MTPLLQVKDLSLSIHGSPILRSVSFDLEQGQTLGVVGESGAGKSMTALSLIRLLPASASLSGSILFNGEELLSKDEAAMCRLRGRQIAMAFQEPMTALNPVLTIGAQVAEVFRKHLGLGNAEALSAAAKVLERVGLPADAAPLMRYPFELSGGQRQRVVLALALALKPKLLIADEPTTALDVHTEAQILDLLNSLCAEDRIALLLVSHDLAVVMRLSDKVAIMKDGEIVEIKPAARWPRAMRHPYSIALYAASTYKPSIRSKADSARSVQPILEVKKLACDYRLARRSFFHAAGKYCVLEDINFVLYKGESLGLVGESGAGKSTLVRAILGLEEVQQGAVHINGECFSPASLDQQAPLRRKIQVVFQDPYGSFNPRHNVERIVAEPLCLLGSSLNKTERGRRVAHCLENVGLAVGDARKYPHEFSGGQRQRIAIARALIVSPSIIVLDEATSALDVSARAQVLELLGDLSARLGIAYLFVSHDLEVVRAVTDRVLILQCGRIVEQGMTVDVFASPRHDYTKSLLGSKPGLQDDIEDRTASKKAHA